MDDLNVYNSQQNRLNELNNKIEEIARKPFTERRMEENIEETNEQVELQVAINQIMQYEHFLIECSQNIRYMNQVFKDELDKKDMLLEEYAQEKENELNSYIRRCEELQEANNELVMKNSTVLNTLQDLEEELNRQKDVQRKLESEIVSMSNQFDEKKEQMRMSVQQQREGEKQNNETFVQKQRELIQQQSETSDLRQQNELLSQQIHLLQTTYSDSLVQIESLKKSNNKLKEMNDHLQLEIIKILEDKDLLYSSDNIDKMSNSQSSIQNGEEIGENGQTNNNFVSSQKKQHTNSIVDTIKNQFSTIYGDLMSDLNKNKYKQNSDYNRSSRNYNNNNENNFHLSQDINKFQSNESKSSRIYNITNQLSQLKNNESFFEGFNPITHRSTDSVQSINLISNLFNNVNSNQDHKQSNSQQNISSSNLQDFEFQDKLELSQKNSSKSPSHSIRSSFESPRIQQIIAPPSSYNKISSNKDVHYDSPDIQKVKNYNDKEIQQQQQQQQQQYQNEIKLEKYGQKSIKGHQRYLSAIPTSKSNSFNESQDDIEQYNNKNNHDNNEQNQVNDQILNYDSTDNSNKNNNQQIVKQCSIVIVKIDVETQTDDNLNQQITNIKSDDQNKEIKQDHQNQEIKLEQKKENVIVEQQKNKVIDIQSNKNKEEVKMNDSSSQKTIQFDNPYYIFFHLTGQTAKMNSKYEDDVVDFDLKPFYLQVQDSIPINKWYKWIDTKLTEMRKEQINKLKK